MRLKDSIKFMTRNNSKNLCLRLFFLVSTLLLSSCGVFIELDQSDELIVFKNENNQKSCQKSSSLVLASQTSANLSNIKEDLLLSAKEHNLTPIEVFTIWSLMQIYLRPNLVSPGSALQFLDVQSSTFEYASFLKNKMTDPFLFFNSLKVILRKYQSKRSLSFLGRIVDEIIPSQVIVDKELASFLTKNSSSITKNKSSHQYYLKGQQVLRKGEGLKTFKMWPVISQSRFLKNKPNTHLFETKIGDKKTARCNFDTRIYKNAVYLIDPKSGLNSHPFSLTYKGKTYMAISSQIATSDQLYPGTYSFKPSSYGGQKAFCKIKTKRANLALLSSKGRDSGQHLFNLIGYKISSAQKKDELIELLDFPRYLFLLNPERMIYESDRSSAKQIQTFLNTSFPIYHKSNLGNIWLHYDIKFKTNSKKGIILDGRQENALSCTN